MVEKVFILHHTHVDFGYTDSRDLVCQELLDMVDQVGDLVDASSERPEPERFRWIHEVSWPVLQYVRRGGPRRARLFEQMRAGRVELTALYVNPTDLFDRERFEVSTDWACELARREGLPLTTAMFSDCPGLAWSVPDILAERKVRYLSAAPDFIMSLPLELERPFYWEGPEGGRVLTWLTEWRNTWYAEGLFLGLTGDPAEGTRRLLQYIRQIEGEGYRWRGLAIHVAMDNAPPAPQLMDFVAYFNSSQGPVRAQLATNREFFEFMEGEHGRQFAVHRGAWPDWWANGSGSAAFETGCSRRAKASLERSAALARRLGLQRDPKRLDEALQDLLLFDEHTWGHSVSVVAPWSPPARLGWEQKRALALGALDKATKLERPLAAQYGEADQLSVVNPFDEDWTGVIALPQAGRGRRAPQLCEVGTPTIIRGQRYRDSVLTQPPGDLYALTVPARAVRRFTRGRPTVAPAPSPALESDHYRIEYDHRSGAILQIVDKLNARSLCDVARGWTFGEVIHERVRRDGRKAMYDITLGAANPVSHRPRPQLQRLIGHKRERRCRLVVGPVFNALLTAGHLPGVRFVREVRLYHAMRRIDVRLRLNKEIVTDYESLYLAFPFAAERPEVRVENAGAVYHAGVEQLPGSATDWLSVGEFVAVSGKQGTTVLAPHEAPLIQVGDIHTGEWARRLEVPNGHLFAWVMNNMWFTNFPACQEGAVELAWSVTSWPGPFDRLAAERFARDARVGVVVQDGKDIPSEHIAW